MSDDHESLIDRMRGMPVGVADPNIIGDAGPTDVPPGSDPVDDDALVDPDAVDGSEPASED